MKRVNSSHYAISELVEGENHIAGILEAITSCFIPETFQFDNDFDENNNNRRDSDDIPPDEALKTSKTSKLSILQLHLYKISCQIDQKTGTLKSCCNNRKTSFINNDKYNKNFHPIYLGFMRELCKYLLAIKILHQDFFQELKLNFDEHQANPKSNYIKIGKIFINNLGFFQVLSDYCLLYEEFKLLGDFKIFEDADKNLKVLNSETIVGKITTEIAAFRDNEAKARHLTSVGVMELFFNIFQRFMRYQMLLDAYIKQLEKQVKNNEKETNDENILDEINHSKNVNEKIKKIVSQGNEEMASSRKQMLIYNTKLISRRKYQSAIDFKTAYGRTERLKNAGKKDNAYQRLKDSLSRTGQEASKKERLFIELKNSNHIHCIGICLNEEFEDIQSENKVIVVGNSIHFCDRIECAEVRQPILERLTALTMDSDGSSNNNNQTSSSLCGLGQLLKCFDSNSSKNKYKNTPDSNPSEPFRVTSEAINRLNSALIERKCDYMLEIKEACTIKNIEYDQTTSKDIVKIIDNQGNLYKILPEMYNIEEKLTKKGGWLAWGEKLAGKGYGWKDLL